MIWITYIDLGAFSIITEVRYEHYTGIWFEVCEIILSVLRRYVCQIYTERMLSKTCKFYSKKSVSYMQGQFLPTSNIQETYFKSYED